MEFIDLKAQHKAYKDDIDAAMLAVVEQGQFIGGSEVECLEAELAAYVGRKHCISCGNGTDALQLAYMVYGIAPGDAVFCPDMTFISSVEPAVMLGATPIFCDIDEDSYNLNPDDLRRKITEVKREGSVRPRFVVAVDFLGTPAAYDEIEAICKEHDLILIEDTAQGIGGTYRGKKLGAFGDIATTSFFPSKPLGCYGDGGAIFTDDDEVAALLKSLKVHGKGSSKYDNVRIGVNSRLDNIQAAVLRVKLCHLDEEMERRQVVARRYTDALSELIRCPFVEEGCRGAYAQYALVASDGDERERLMGALKAEGVPSLIYYPNTMHSMKAFDLKPSADFAVSTWYAERNFAVPMSAFLTETDQDRVIGILKGVLG